MSNPFLTEPVSGPMGIRFIANTNTTTKHPYTPNSSQTVTAINGIEPSWELQILL